MNRVERLHKYLRCSLHGQVETQAIQKQPERLQRYRSDSYTPTTETMSKGPETLNREGDSETLQEPGYNATSHRKDFSSLQIIALGFNVSNSWVAIATSFAVVVAAGGPVTLVYGVIISCLVYAAVAISLAELASIYPTAGGQYHFTALIAPRSVSRSTSYVCGAIAAFSWVALCTAATILGAQALLALPQAFVNGYIAQPWHYFMVYQAISVVVLLFNLFGLRRMLWVHDVGCKYLSGQRNLPLLIPQLHSPLPLSS